MEQTSSKWILSVGIDQGSPETFRFIIIAKTLHAQNLPVFNSNTNHENVAYESENNSDRDYNDKCDLAKCESFLCCNHL